MSSSSRGKKSAPSASFVLAAADASAAALLFVGVEAVVVAGGFHRELVGAWEAKAGFTYLVPIAWGLAAVTAVASAGTLVAMRTERLFSRVISAIGAGAFGAFVAGGTSFGRHFASAPVRAVWVLAFALGGSLIGWFSARPIGRAANASPLRVAGAAAIAIATLIAADALALPHLYPLFHLALTLAAWALAPYVSLAWAKDAPAKSQLSSLLFAAIMLIAPAAALAFVLPAASRALAPMDNVRYVFGTHGPTLRYAVELVALGLPESTTDGSQATIANRADAAAGPSFEGRDIVVISIDALRADHVGAYGYARPTTPEIDALAKEGVRFDHAYTATPHTSYAVTSLMTGKYMRPLLLQGAGADSDTLAKLLRTYGYRTAGFYPPAVFFIDPERFEALRASGLDFEYRRVEFLPASERAAQVEAYLARVREGRRVLLWVHLFEPHEPYEAHLTHDFGPRDVDRYDGEIAEADAGVGAIVRTVRARRPNAVIVVTADHGEEFGDHGGRYHGTSVFDEQVRVPLIVVAPGILAPHVAEAPVQTVDVMPTILDALRIPRPARVRGRSFSRLFSAEKDDGFAFAETDEATLVAEDKWRLVCARKLAACQLFDVATDPREEHDVSAKNSDEATTLRKALREIEASHGRLEVAGLRAEGKAYPEALRRAIAGDVDAAIDVAALLEDADVSFRRKAAEVLFELAVKDTAPALRLAVTRDEDDVVKRWASVALTRLGEGSGRTLELVDDKEIAWRKVAALALAEGGDDRGAAILERWIGEPNVPFERAKQIIRALGVVKDKAAIVPIGKTLADVRLRPIAAEALAKIGDAAARGFLVDAFAKERRLPLRQLLGEALVKLGARGELAAPLARFLGVPDPMPNGVDIAIRSRILPSIGGPDEKELPRLLALHGPMTVHLVVPRGASDQGLRLIVRGHARSTNGTTLRVGLPLHGDRSPDPRLGPNEIDSATAQRIELAPGDEVEHVIDLPPAYGAHGAIALALVVDAPDDAAISGLVVIPRADELPPPPPEPWSPPSGEAPADVVDDGT